MRSSEREKNLLVEELTAQNARLTSQLEAANQLEIQLNNKLQETKNQYSIQHTQLQVNRKMGKKKKKQILRKSNDANE